MPSSTGSPLGFGGEPSLQRPHQHQLSWDELYRQVTLLTGQRDELRDDLEHMQFKFGEVSMLRIQK